jgi:hypothetical protein
MTDVSVFRLSSSVEFQTEGGENDERRTQDRKETMDETRTDRPGAEQAGGGGFSGV